MSKTIEYMNVVSLGDIRISNLQQNDQMRVVLFTEDGATVKYGRYTGSGYLYDAPEINDVHLFDNGFWMWDGTKWLDVNNCYAAKDEHVTDDIPFTDFSNILEEEVEASECL